MNYVQAALQLHSYLSGHSRDVIEIWRAKTLMTALSNSSNRKFICHSCRYLQSFDEMVPIIGILH